MAQRYEKEMKKADKKNIIIKYKQYLKLEKSLSANTVEAYLTDLDKLFAFLELENIHFTDVTLENLETFSAGLRDIGIHPRSQARILSGIRSFFRFLLLEDYIQQDPSELLESPQIGKHLPDVLTVEEIDTLIGSIDRSTREGQRNRAILETLYSCGLRVSELCNLKLSDLYLKEKFIKVEGKGSKQRLVPISSRAIRELELYFPDRNEGLIKPGYEDFVFISRFGKNISRIMVFHIIKELAEHNMLVDLGRNDVGKISRPGSVKVDKYMEIQRFSHVMHIGSTVTGTISEEKDALDVVDAILPAGTLSGAPKIRACEIIAELEKEKRGIYGGAVGYLDFTGNVDTCISIRLAYKKNGSVRVQSGAGIVADSIPENEFQECLNKAGAVLQAIKIAEGGLE